MDAAHSESEAKQNTWWSYCAGEACAPSAVPVSIRMAKSIQMGGRVFRQGRTYRAEVDLAAAIVFALSISHCGTRGCVTPPDYAVLAWRYLEEPRGQ